MLTTVLVALDQVSVPEDAPLGRFAGQALPTAPNRSPLPDNRS
ncbi:hypothetical protein [Streptomyces sp. SID8111]|nr:hypothetical protein [Streptomyces sp. SID8111]